MRNYSRRRKILWLPRPINWCAKAAKSRSWIKIIFFFFFEFIPAYSLRHGGVKNKKETAILISCWSRVYIVLFDKNKNRVLLDHLLQTEYNWRQWRCSASEAVHRCGRIICCGTVTESNNFRSQKRMKHTPPPSKIVKKIDTKFPNIPRPEQRADQIFCQVVLLGGNCRVRRFFSSPRLFFWIGYIDGRSGSNHTRMATAMWSGCIIW